MDEFAKAADRAMSRFSGQFVGTTRATFQIKQLEKEVKSPQLNFNALFPKIFGPNVQGTFIEFPTEVLSVKP